MCILQRPRVGENNAANQRLPFQETGGREATRTKLVRSLGGSKREIAFETAWITAAIVANAALPVTCASLLDRTPRSFLVAVWTIWSFCLRCYLLMMLAVKNCRNVGHSVCVNRMCT